MTLLAMEKGYDVDVITTDFSKAFDKISHQIIYLKLQAFGFPPSFIKWVKSYLENRSYKVVFRNEVSDPFLASSGVPQGSHLGPLIFVLAINDVGRIISFSDLSIYADDIKIIKVISSSRDSSLLQLDLNTFLTWCNKNFLDLNISKCQSMTFSRKRIPSNPRIYHFCNIPVPIVSSIRDLGVICDKELNFRSHIDHIIGKANSSLGFVKRWSKEFSNPHVTKSLFTTYVRPILEYASQVWSPFQITQSVRIEAVQRRFLRFALRSLPWSDPVILPPYEDRLQLIGMYSLSQRRRIADIIFVHQLIIGAIDSPALLEWIKINTNPRSLRAVPFFRLPIHRTNYGHFNPMSRMLRLANTVQDIFDFSISSPSLRRTLYTFSP